MPGDESTFLITTYGAINNNGASYTSASRSVTKSSANTASCASSSVYGLLPKSFLLCSHRHCNLVQQPAHYFCVCLHIVHCTHFMSMMFILTQRPIERSQSFVRIDQALFLRIIFEYRSARVCRYLERSSTSYSDAIGNLGGMNVYIRNTNFCRIVACDTISALPMIVSSRL